MTKRFRHTVPIVMKSKRQTHIRNALKTQRKGYKKGALHWELLETCSGVGKRYCTEQRRGSKTGRGKRH